MTPPRLSRTVALTLLAMLVFAANSVLCRMALGSTAIDAAKVKLRNLRADRATVAGELAQAQVDLAAARIWYLG